MAEYIYKYKSEHILGNAYVETHPAFKIVVSENDDDIYASCKIYLNSTMIINSSDYTGEELYIDSDKMIATDGSKYIVPTSEFMPNSITFDDYALVSKYSNSISIYNFAGIVNNDYSYGDIVEDPDFDILIKPRWRRL